MVGSQGVESFPHTSFAIGCKGAGADRFCGAHANRFSGRSARNCKPWPRPKRGRRSGSGASSVAFVRRGERKNARRVLSTRSSCTRSLRRTPQPPTHVLRSVPSLSISTSADVARLQEDRRLAGHADARRRAGEDHVARQQRADLRDVRDQFVDLEDELLGARVLHRLAVEAQLNPQVVRVRHFVGRRQRRSERSEGVERLAEQPLLAGLVELPIAGRNVVARAVAGDVLERLRLRNVFAAAADDDDQLRFVVDFVSSPSAARSDRRARRRPSGTCRRTTGSSGGSWPLSFAWSA